MVTQALFKDDAYLSVCEAKLVTIGQDGGLIFDQTCFHADSGGQPGDIGFIERIDGSRIRIQDTRYQPDGLNIVHLPALDNDSKTVSDEEIEETFFLHIDWTRRYRLMRMHSACHLLANICGAPTSDAQLGEDESWIELEKSNEVDLAALNAQMTDLVKQNHPIFCDRITNKNLNTKQPSGMGKVRFVYIGQNGEIDVQACDGTHVSETQEISDIKLAKIEKHGRLKCQIRLGFGTR